MAASPECQRPALAAALATLRPDAACVSVCRQVEGGALLDTLGLAAGLATDSRLGCEAAVATALRAGDARARREVAQARGGLASCSTLPRFIEMAAAIAVDDAPLFAMMCLLLTPGQEDSLLALRAVDASLARAIAAQLLRADPIGARLPSAAVVRLVADAPSTARASLLRDIAALGPMLGASEAVVEALARCSPARRQTVLAALLAGQRGEVGLLLDAQHVVDQLREAEDEPHVLALVRALRGLGFVGYDLQQGEALAILRTQERTELEAITGLGRRLAAHAGTAWATLRVRDLEALVAVEPTQRQAAVAAYEAHPAGQEILPSPFAFLSARATGTAEPELTDRLPALPDLEERLAGLTRERRTYHLQQAQRFVPFRPAPRQGAGNVGRLGVVPPAGSTVNPIFWRAAAHHRENVEDAPSRALAAHNIAVLSERGCGSRLSATLVDVEETIAAIEATTPQDSTAWRVRGGGHTFTNARRALSGIDVLVAPEVTAARLLAWVWAGIDRYPLHAVEANLDDAAVADHRALMRWAVIKALEQCIEDDGHRVCCNGTAQRLTFALAGYIRGIMRPDVVSGVAIFNIEVEAFRVQLRRQAQEDGVVLAALPANTIFPEPGLETPEATLVQLEAWMARMRQVHQELVGRRQEDFLLATRAAATTFAAWPAYAAAHPGFPEVE